MVKSTGNGSAKSFLICLSQTLFINLTGAFILGFVFGIKANVFVYAVVGTGVLGGYTTFSTMNTELVELYKSKNYRGLVFYALASYIGGVVLVFLGYYLGHIFCIEKSIFCVFARMPFLIISL